MVTNSTAQSGFALIMSLIVVGVVISIGLSILEISVKQVRLSTNARDSEIAFHAANAGMECARYWRRAQEDLVETGAALSPAPTCFRQAGPDAGFNTNTTISATADGSVYKYDYRYTWGPDTGADRCTEITTLVAVATLPGAGLLISNMDGPTGLIPGYRGGDTKFCEAGARCTTISVRGYNRTCTAASTVGTVQREVLLEF